MTPMPERLSFRAALLAIIIYALRRQCQHNCHFLRVIWAKRRIRCLIYFITLSFHNNPKVGLGFIPLTFSPIHCNQSTSKFCLLVLQLYSRIIYFSLLLNPFYILFPVSRVQAWVPLLFMPLFYILYSTSLTF